MLKQAFGKASVVFLYKYRVSRTEKGRRIILSLSSAGFLCLKHVSKWWLSP